jgi:hypothetical protein
MLIRKKLLEINRKFTSEFAQQIERETSCHGLMPVRHFYVIQHRLPKSPDFSGCYTVELPKSLLVSGLERVSRRAWMIY